MDSAHKFSPISPRLLVPLLLVLPALILSACGDEKKSEDSRTPGQATIKTGPDDWPHFGRDEQRSHFLAGPERLNPPLKQRWSFSDRVLIEFPPAIVGGVAYLADKYGDVRALRLSDQKVLWDIQKDHRNVGPPTDTTAPLSTRATSSSPSRAASWSRSMPQPARSTGSATCRPGSSHRRSWSTAGST